MPERNFIYIGHLGENPTRLRRDLDLSEQEVIALASCFAGGISFRDEGERVSIIQSICETGRQLARTSVPVGHRGMSPTDIQDMGKLITQIKDGNWWFWFDGARTYHVEVFLGANGVGGNEVSLLTMETDLRPSQTARYRLEMALTGSGLWQLSEISVTEGRISSDRRNSTSARYAEVIGVDRGPVLNQMWEGLDKYGTIGYRLLDPLKSGA